MSNGKASAQEKVAAGVAMAAQDGAWVPAPRFYVDVACYGPEGLKWTDRLVHADGSPGNVVVNQGAAHVINRLFGSGGASTAGCFLRLHSATTASNHVWSGISASQVGSYGANVPLITFASTYTDRSASASCSYGFTAGTQTVSGACVQFYTTNTMSTNAATGDVLQYSEGQFAASRQVIANDTLNASVTISYGTA